MVAAEAEAVMAAEKVVATVAGAMVEVTAVGAMAEVTAVATTVEVATVVLMAVAETAVAGKVAVMAEAVSEEVPTVKAMVEVETVAVATERPGIRVRCTSQHARRSRHLLRTENRTPAVLMHACTGWSRPRRRTCKHRRVMPFGACRPPNCCHQPNCLMALTTTQSLLAGAREAAAMAQGIRGRCTAHRIQRGRHSPLWTSRTGVGWLHVCIGWW